jgi:hypothetical protein
MARDFTFGSFLKEIGMRIGAAVVVVGVFFGLGYLNRTDFLGLSSILGNRSSFFAVSFGVIGILSLSWLGVQQYSK